MATPNMAMRNLAANRTQLQNDQNRMTQQRNLQNMQNRFAQASRPNSTAGRVDPATGTFIPGSASYTPPPSNRTATIPASTNPYQPVSRSLPQPTAGGFNFNTVGRQPGRSIDPGFSRMMPGGFRPNEPYFRSGSNLIGQLDSRGFGVSQPGGYMRPPANSAEQRQLDLLYNDWRMQSGDSRELFASAPPGWQPPPNFRPSQQAVSAMFPSQQPRALGPNMLASNQIAAKFGGANPFATSGGFSNGLIPPASGGPNGQPWAPPPYYNTPSGAMPRPGQSMPAGYNALPQLWQNSSANPWLQGQQLPQRLDMLARLGMPLSPAMVNAATGRGVGLGNIAAAFTGRGGGTAPSLQALRNMDDMERDMFLGGYTQGVLGIPQESLIQGLQAMTRNLGSAAVAR